MTNTEGSFRVGVGFFVLGALAITAGTVMCAGGVLDSLAEEGLSMAQNGVGIYGAIGPDHYEFFLGVVILSLAAMVLVPVVARTIHNGNQELGVPVASMGVGIAALVCLMTVAIGSQMGTCVSDNGSSCYGSVVGMADAGTAAWIFGGVAVLFLGAILWFKSTQSVSRQGIHGEMANKRL